MINFIITNWDSVLVVILFIVACIVLARKGSAVYVKQMLFYLVTQAEAEYGAGTGNLKYAAVTTWLYERIPAILKFFFTAKQIDKMIEAAVEQMKEYLKKNTSAQAFVVTTNEVNNVIPIAIPKKE
jgi:hypothetical protein